jgi:O-methyltransferase
MISLKFIYSNLRKLAAFFGIHLSLNRIRKNEEYEPVSPGATYAPWLSDKNFQKTFEMVKNYTMVDKYRCFELWQLVAESAKFQGALIEVGVWRGGTGALIAKSAELNGIKDTLYLCDTFGGVVKAGNKDSRYTGGEHANTSKEIVQELVFQKLKMSNHYCPVKIELLG